MRFKVFMACALGGGIGALVALQLAPALWWIGILIGGLVGYLSYEFRAVLQAVPKAWEMARREVPELMTRDNLWALVNITLTIGSCGLALALTMGLIFWRIRVGALQGHSLLDIPVLVLAVIATAGIVQMLSKASEMEVQDPKLALYVNPISYLLGLIVLAFQVALALTLGATWGIILVMTKIPLGLWKTLALVILVVLIPLRIALVIKHLFLLIHSDLRLLCASYAMIGAIIGFTFGNALIGAAAGGALGLLGFELIFRLYHNTAPSSTR